MERRLVWSEGDRGDPGRSRSCSLIHVLVIVGVVDVQEPCFRGGSTQSVSWW